MFKKLFYENNKWTALDCPPKDSKRDGYVTVWKFKNDCMSAPNLWLSRMCQKIRDKYGHDIDKHELMAMTLDLMKLECVYADINFYFEDDGFVIGIGEIAEEKLFHVSATHI
ncbi:MAG: hypothetical protein KBC17_01150 [Candidatus Pacebacteria bacterium]|nr:hypothetical protein [Candidatus Paceibacterota bacterium]